MMPLRGLARGRGRGGPLRPPSLPSSQTTDTEEAEKGPSKIAFQKIFHVSLCSHIKLPNNYYMVHSRWKVL